MSLVYLLLVTLVTSFLGTISGFGVSTLMVPLVLIFLPLSETLLLVGIIHWFSDIWKIFLFKKGIDYKILLFFGIPGVLFAWWGGTLSLKIPSYISSPIIGVVLILYVIYLILNPKFKIKKSAVVSTLGGTFSGLLGGLTGIAGGALRAMVLTSYHLPKETYIFTAGLLGAVIDLSRISSYIVGGTRIPSNLILALILCIPTSFVSAELAKRYLKRIDNNLFRKIIAFFLFILGIKLIFLP